MVLLEAGKLMQDSTNTEKRQAEALSAAIDRLNQGLPLENKQEEEITELLYAAKLVKVSAKPLAVPPPAVLNHIVEQAVRDIAQKKRKKRVAWGIASLGGTAAAVLLIILLHGMPPSTQEPQLAKTPAQTAPAPATEALQSPSIGKTPVTLTTPPDELQAPAVDTETTVAAQPESEVATPAPSVALALDLPPASIPSASATMLVLADRKADSVTIDAISKTIRQVYRQGEPDEIIITQAPKRTNELRSVPMSPPILAKKSIRKEIVANNLSNRNKVTVIIDNNEVTLEGAGSQEELLNLAKTLTEVSAAR
jgi:hypothetical protein